MDNQQAVLRQRNAELEKELAAKNRELEIEAGLEKVRSRALTMHHSKELKEVVTVVFETLQSLDFSMPGAAAIICIFTEGSKDIVQWIADPRRSYAVPFNIPYYENPFTADMFNAKEQGKDFFSGLYPFEIKNDYFNFLFTNSDFRYVPDEVKKMILESRNYGFSIAFAKNSAILIPATTGTLLSVDEANVLKRFAKVFDQAYTRFLDLQKAEANTREAQIEASLERVRARTMAMHNSEDVTVATETMFNELQKLGINNLRGGVANIHPNGTFNVFTVTNLNSGNTMRGFDLFSMNEHPIWQRWFESWRNNEEVFIAYMAGQEKEEHINIVNNHQNYFKKQIVQFPDNFFQAYHFDQGALYAYSLLEHTKPEKEIMKRFASVFSLTFHRYQDLKKAEASAREAIKQAALDRIRAEIASMRTISDLDRITPLIWNELNILGVPFIRCGVFIMDDSQQLIHTFLSTPEGKAIAAFQLPYGTPGHFAEVIDHWRTRKIYIEKWSENDFISISEILVKQGAIAIKEQYLNTLPEGIFILHFLPFLQGMLYVGNITQLSQDDIKLIQHVADAFSTAYARYEDFNKLEAAKQQVDKTLGDLKQAQKQLIQSEKMASLGELTAGIAHEIQNPLNFINNFSEVNVELADELKEEINSIELSVDKKSSIENIIDDIIKNEEKINHHGKRADAIVKGMLQHSRSSSGQKEPTDINALADEYLRLSYHGLRAKDKDFNATLQTDFNATPAKINVVPQDIGRVLLNLYNNAFYAVNERSKEEGVGYEHTVSVRTKKVDDKIEIQVKDNGVGIPQKVVEKIFQPFFTTKPTGQGTGLGLSLSYDIIKAHGGEIKVESKEGEGSEFIIQLPFT